MEENKWRYVIDCPICFKKALFTQGRSGQDLLRCPHCGLARETREYVMPEKELKWVVALIEKEKHRKKYREVSLNKDEQ